VRFTVPEQYEALPADCDETRWSEYVRERAGLPMKKPIGGDDRQEGNAGIPSLHRDPGDDPGD
jgi:hypothetical protein